jgi:hypothetical protein
MAEIAKIHVARSIANGREEEVEFLLVGRRANCHKAQVLMQVHPCSHAPPTRTVLLVDISVLALGLTSCRAHDRCTWTSSPR